ncbi:MAG: ABC transporter ATP-binding protein/permease [Clostridiales bacterium]|jgi:ATP-binding cassette subfamily B protein|nr:ABC transporter ATP-binding protein/permease [Clostridiales bacterium]
MNEFEDQEYTKNFEFSVWKKLYRYIRGFKRQLFTLVFNMVMVALLDAVLPLMTKYAIDEYIIKKQTSGLPLYIAAYALFTAMMAGSVYIFVYLAGKVEVGVVCEIRKHGFKKLQELSFSYYDTTAVGWIMARMTSDAQRIGDTVSWGIIDIAWSVAIIIFVVVNMFILNPTLALLLCAVMPALALVTFYFQKKIFANQRTVRRLNSRITGAYNEGINGAKTTKTLVSEENNFNEFKALTSGMKEASIRSAVLSSLLFPIVLALSSVGMALVLTHGGRGVMLGTIGLGTLSVFVAYTRQMFDPIQQLARIFAELQSAQASAERTLTLIETEPDIKDTPEVVAKYGDALNPLRENWEEITGEVVFENVGFKYKSGERVLEDFNLRVKPGEKIALVGETGAGKSTIVNLVCRFYEPTEGRILIDGADYRERAQIWLQSGLGYVLQAPHLFSGTVMENIRYAKLDAADEEVYEAARAVNAYDFIMKLEKGFETQVGEGGGKLSSGEKQLVSFARAILGDPKIFVLDEATSSVDTETEQVIQRSVESVLHGRTSFIVAHRLSTIRHCDRILLIHDGKILEEGSHRALIKKRGRYYDLYTNQFKAEAEQAVLSKSPA